jgi:hypothetical protein
MSAHSRKPCDNSAKLESAWKMYHKVKTGDYLASLHGTIGLQPLGT